MSWPQEDFAEEGAIPRQLMHPDKGTNFTGASRELTEALKLLNQERITVELVHQGFSKYFNPPYGSNLQVINEASETIHEVHHY